MFYLSSLLITRHLLVFTLLHSCFIRVDSYSLVFTLIHLCSPLFTRVLLVFTLIHSCSTLAHTYSLVITHVHWVFYSYPLVFICVLPVFTGVHLCSHSCGVLDQQTNNIFTRLAALVKSYREFNVSAVHL